MPPTVWPKTNPMNRVEGRGSMMENRREGRRGLILDLQSSILDSAIAIFDPPSSILDPEIAILNLPSSILDPNLTILYPPSSTRLS